MGLFGSIYIGKSGVSTMSFGIGVTADNLANLESTGFRGSRALFEDLFGWANTEAPPYDQSGLGSRVEDVEIIYREGPIKQTDQPTDLAISGKGFFVVSDGENVYYTRDGQFLPNETTDGRIRLSLPSGYDLLGWICPEGVDCETITSGTLEEFPRYMDGQGTSKITIQMNFDAGKPAEETDLDLYDKWDATASSPLPEGTYDMKVEVPIYDELGNLHQLNFYFDRTAENRVFEFMVAIDPALDTRGEGRYSGALMTGRIRFGSLGQIEGMEDLAYITDPEGTKVPLGEGDFSADGFPLLKLNFGSQVQNIALDFGTYFDPLSSSWQRIDEHASTAFASPYAVINQNSDGYPPGFFETLSVSEKGVLEVRYTNEQTVPLARVPLAIFGSPDDLERAGGNLFKSVKGAVPDIFAPGKSAPGAIFGGALEHSNVDVANEMVHLITLQRAFQSNARIITTADEMLADFLRQV